MNTKAWLHGGSATPEEALEIFDALAPVGLDFMIGRWAGSGCATGHPMDGLLEAYHWYGKRFDNAEQVHPLVFTTGRGGQACVNPALLEPLFGLIDRRWVPKAAVAGRLFQWLLPLLTTSKSRARLRMTEYRGRSSATMIYDQLPINDVFRKIDDHTVLGLMDRKGMTQPFFFMLRRLPAAQP